MALLSIAEACRKAGISKPTMYNNYIKTGKISVSEDNRGKKGIDLSEILRVFGEIKGIAQGDVLGDEKTAQPDQSAQIIAAQQQQINLLTDQLRREQARADQFYTDLQQAQARLLAPPEKKGFFARLFGNE